MERNRMGVSMSCSRYSDRHTGYRMRGIPPPRSLCDGLLLVLCIQPLVQP